MKFNKKIILSFLVIFILTNIFYLYTQVFAGVMVDEIITAMNGTTVEPPQVFSTVLHLLIAAAQVFFTGYYIISLSIQGIKYASFVAMMPPEEQKKAKEKLTWTFFKGVIAFSITSLVRILYDWVA